MADGITLAVNATGTEKAAASLKKVGGAVKGVGKDFQGATARADKLAAALRGPLKAAFTATAAAATASVVAMGGITKAAIRLSEEANQVAKNARKIGTTAEELQVLQGALDLLTAGGIDASRVIQDLGRNLADARDNTGEAKDELKKLGLTAADLVKLPVDEQVALISERFGVLRDNAERSQVAMAIFGRAGRQLVPALTAGGEAIRKATEDIKAAGLVTNQLAADSEALQDSILLAANTFGSFKRDTLAPLVPALTSVSDALRIVMQDMRESGEAAEFGQSIKRAFVEVAVPAVAFFAQESERAMAGFRVTMALTEKLITGATMVLKSFGDSKEFVVALDDYRAATANLDAATVDFINTQDTSAERWEKFVENAAQATGAVQEFQRAAQGDAAVPGVAPGANGPPGQDPVEQRVQAQLDAYREYYAELQQLQQDAYLAEQERMRMLDEQRRQYLADSLTATQAGITAVGDLAGSVSTMVTALYGQNSKEAKAAAKAAFIAQKAAALAEATVNMAVSISEANASAPYPYNIPAIVAASVTGGAQIASIVATTIAGVADAGLPPGALKQAGLNNHTVLAVRRDEMVLDPKGTQAITEMLQARQYGGGSQPVVVNTRLELDGRVLGETVDDHLVRSSERGLNYQSRIRYGRAS